jgi:hypothetical protein
MQHDPKFHRSDVLNDQIPIRRQVKLKSSLVLGSVCYVVRVRRGADDEEEWVEVGEQFEADGGPLRFQAPYDEEVPLYGLVERWPDGHWCFYQLDVVCPEDGA